MQAPLLTSVNMSIQLKNQLLQQHQQQQQQHQQQPVQYPTQSELYAITNLMSMRKNSIDCIVPSSPFQNNTTTTNNNNNNTNSKNINNSQNGLFSQNLPKLSIMASPSNSVPSSPPMQSVSLPYSLPSISSQPIAPIPSNPLNSTYSGLSKTSPNFNSPRCDSPSSSPNLSNSTSSQSSFTPLSSPSIYPQTPQIQNGNSLSSSSTSIPNTPIMGSSQSNIGVPCNHCLVCERGPPSIVQKNPTWSTIMRVVFYTLTHCYPERPYFNLRTDVYAWMVDHWDILCATSKDKSHNWRKQVQDMLSHSKNLFESGSDHYKQNGFWRLKKSAEVDPWTIKKPQRERSKIPISTKHSSKRSIDECYDTQMTSGSNISSPKSNSINSNCNNTSNNNTNNNGKKYKPSPISTPMMSSSTCLTSSSQSQMDNEEDIMENDNWVPRNDDISCDLVAESSDLFQDMEYVNNQIYKLRIQLLNIKEKINYNEKYEQLKLKNSSNNIMLKNNLEKINITSLIKN
ncbi:hypothetical protein DLAC_05999 [Tieghemostelium lacteum]|uniref:Uncharacterized protein n=1 Tax=Tieghemostelium lacteum TaxID=361077 RepID=A0A151ZHE2_TIELA|nr:hypothetical protein DLAC_05999 [Tieghemostelium lacteum]|eukprot:KYQ93329.1 hypothetical protein DLAC_05999 [Tieghemostelium lacteum]